MKTIYPVVLAVPEQVIKIKGREKVKLLSQHARTAAEISANHGGIGAVAFLKNDRGIPLPFQGNFWSVTHKTLYVAGVVAPGKIGIDIERIRYISSGLFEKTAHDSEWDLASTPRSLLLFFRFWTAKEAVLKATGIGIKGLLQCKVIEITDSSHLILDYRNQYWSVEHFFYNGHIATVVQNDFVIKWIVDSG